MVFHVLFYMSLERLLIDVQAGGRGHGGVSVEGQG